MESSQLVIFLTSGKFITKFNALSCISLSETLFWTGARGRIPITVTETNHSKARQVCICFITEPSIGCFPCSWSLYG